MNRLNKTPLNLFYALLLLFVGCAKPMDPPKLPVAAQAAGASVPDTWAGQGRSDVVIFGGVTAWKAEVDSIKAILYKHGATYEEIDSERLNAFTLDDFARYKLLIFPGGYAPTMVDFMTLATRERIRSAVQLGGLNYLGFCAGAWIAVGPAPAPGQPLAYGLGVANGAYLDKNFLGKKGLDHAIDRARFADGSRRNLLWYGGPVTPSLPGGVVARYSDGAPAVSQMRSGQGFVIVSGLHPAATMPMLEFLGLNDKEAIAPDFAWMLLKAGIQGKPMPAFK